MAKGSFQVKEVDGGTVTLLLVVNGTSERVFLLDGEELVGARQNRILNLSHPRLRHDKAEQVHESLRAGMSYESDQGQVWQSVREVLYQSKVASPTAGPAFLVVGASVVAIRPNAKIE